MSLNIPIKVKDLSERMNVIRNDLAGHVQRDFADAFSPSSKGQINFENIRNACLVADRNVFPI